MTVREDSPAAFLFVEKEFVEKEEEERKDAHPRRASRVD